MYLTPETIRVVEEKYGTPDVIAFVYEMKPNEFEMVRRTQKNGRAHDVTLFIMINEQIVVIRKPMYPAGAYRPPSGGISPGEQFEDGALREALEETGLAIILDRYLVRARVRFTCGPLAIAWTTHVLSARPVSELSFSSGSPLLQPLDRQEIEEARIVTLEELKGDIKNALLKGKSTGLRYRAELTDAVLARLTVNPG